jgi:hypothetical protein
MFSAKCEPLPLGTCWYPWANLAAGRARGGRVRPQRVFVESPWLAAAPVQKVSCTISLRNFGLAPRPQQSCIASPLLGGGNGVAQRAIGSGSSSRIRVASAANSGKSVLCCKRGAVVGSDSGLQFSGVRHRRARRWARPLWTGCRKSEIHFQVRRPVRKLPPQDRLESVLSTMAGAERRECSSAVGHSARCGARRWGGISIGSELPGGAVEAGVWHRGASGAEWTKWTREGLTGG